jgi:hypothetical protein
VRRDVQPSAIDTLLGEELSGLRDRLAAVERGLPSDVVDRTHNRDRWLVAGSAVVGFACAPLATYLTASLLLGFGFLIVAPAAIVVLLGCLGAVAYGSNRLRAANLREAIAVGERGAVLAAGGSASPVAAPSRAPREAPGPDRE